MSFSHESLRQLAEQAGLRKIRVTGNGIQACCPFHHNTKTPAWGMNTEGLWKCLNPNCGRTGNLVGFLVEVMGMAAVDAVRFTPDRTVDLTGIKLPAYEDRGLVSYDVEYVPDAILEKYRVCPTYMLGRGFRKGFLAAYEIGFDAEANRVTFPVRHHDSKQLLGFTRRRVDGNDWPPYLHDFERESTLYLLHRVPEGCPVLVSEGSTDALMARQLALDIDPAELFPDQVELDVALSNATATLGGGLTKARVATLSRRGHTKVFLAFDNDKAGQAATDWSVDLLLEAGIADVHVLRFPGKDIGALDIEKLSGVSCIPYWRRHLVPITYEAAEAAEQE